MSDVNDLTPEGPMAPVTLEELGEQTRNETIGCALSFTWLGTTAVVKGSDLVETASHFDARPNALRLSKRVLDSRHPTVRQLNRVKSGIRRDWIQSTLPYVEPGVRLMRRDRTNELAQAVRQASEVLDSLSVELEDRRREVLEQAEARLGRLFDPNDYPVNFAGCFGVELAFPNLEPPDYLRGLSPELYEREQQRIAASFEQAVATAEAQFQGQLAELVSHLRDRLAGRTEDGRPHVFRDSAVNNLREFFGHVRSVTIRRSSDLEELLQQAEGLIEGVDTGALRQDMNYRERIAGDLAGLEEELTERAPARRIRPARSFTQGETEES